MVCHMVSFLWSVTNVAWRQTQLGFYPKESSCWPLVIYNSFTSVQNWLLSGPLSMKPYRNLDILYMVVWILSGKVKAKTCIANTHCVRYRESISSNKNDIDEARSWGGGSRKRIIWAIGRCGPVFRSADIAEIVLSLTSMACQNYCRGWKAGTQLQGQYRTWTVYSVKTWVTF